MSRTYWNSRKAVPIDDGAGSDEDRAEHEGDHPARRDRALDEPPHHEEGPLATDSARQRVLAVLDEPPCDVIGCAVGTEVLGCRQPFLDAAVEPAECAHLVGRFRRPPDVGSAR